MGAWLEPDLTPEGATKLKAYLEAHPEFSASPLPTPALQPPPDLTNWLLIEPSRNRQGGGYVVRLEPAADHRCPLPAELTHGAIWRCPDGHLWTVTRNPLNVSGGYTPSTPQWWPASWWQRRRYGGRKALLSMAEPSSRFRKPGHPPEGPSGISPSPDGRR